MGRHLRLDGQESISLFPFLTGLFARDLLGSASSSTIVEPPTVIQGGALVFVEEIETACVPMRSRKVTSRTSVIFMMRLRISLKS